jgi:hypothetical protein
VQHLRLDEWVQLVMSILDNLANNLASSKGSIIREIQRDLLDEEVSVASVLRKARLTARKLDLVEMQDWIKNESDGYSVKDLRELPSYRQISITPRFHNPYNGWRPILTDDPRLHELISTGYLKQPIEELEALCRTKGQLTYTYSNELTSLLRSQMEYPFDIRGFASVTQMKGVLNGVKNTLLDWAVDLERAGILGEGLGFSNEEKAGAAAVTQNIFAQNIGNLGNVSGESSVNNNLTGNNFAVTKSDEYISQIEESLPNLPAALRGTVENELKRVRANKGNGTVLKSSLASIRKVCEGVVTSVAAQGIAAYLKAHGL